MNSGYYEHVKCRIYTCLPTKMVFQRKLASHEHIFFSICVADFINFSSPVMEGWAVPRLPRSLVVDHAAS